MRRRRQRTRERGIDTARRARLAARAPRFFAALVAVLASAALVGLVLGLGGSAQVAQAQGKPSDKEPAMRRPRQRPRERSTQIAGRRRLAPRAAGFFAALVAILASAAVVGLVLGLGGSAQVVQAQGGPSDFDLTFAAAEPSSYDHSTGGGAYDDDTSGVDTVSSLAPSEVSCGDTITFLLLIEVDATPSDPVQSIAVDFAFDADSTGNSGVGYTDITNVAVNYGAVSGGDGPGGTDSGIFDDFGSTATLTSETLPAAPFTSGAELLGTVTIDDLEFSETVVVRIDVLLECDPGSSPTGTVQAALADANVVDPTPSAIPAGTQTIPLNQVQNLPFPEIAIDKVFDGFGSAIDADGSGDLSAGDTISYTITVSNPGNTTLTNVTVSDPLLVGTLTSLSDIAGDGATVLAAGASETATGTYVITPADVATGQIDNTATADSDETDALQDSETVQLPSPSLTIDKSLASNADGDGSGDVSVGDVLTYDLKVTSTGTANLTNVTIVDPLTGTNTNVGTLNAGAMTTVQGTYTVQASDVVAGTIDNTATTDSDQTGSEQDSETVPVPQPGLGITKSFLLTNDADGSGDISAGDTITYTITVTNTGTANLTNVTVNDTLLGGPLTLSDNAGDGVAVLAVGHSETAGGDYVVQASDVTASRIDNTASADSDQADPVEVAKTVLLTGPVLEIDKIFDGFGSAIDADVSGDLSAGDTISYTITVKNAGSANLTGVTVTDPLLGGALTLVDSRLANGAGFLVPGEEETASGTYVVLASDVATGQIDNTATTDSDQTASVPDSETVSLPSPSLTIDKSLASNADGDGSGDVSVGDVLTYDLKATSTGTANLTNVTIVDPLTGTNTNVGTLNAGAMTTVQGTYTVQASDVVAGTIDNTATADSDQTGSVQDSASVAVPQPGLGITKSFSLTNDADGSGDVTAGDTITYTITVTNTGTANLTNVTIDDPLTGTNTNVGTLTPGGVSTIQPTYVVLQSDLDSKGTNEPDDAGAGFLDNTATATADRIGPVQASVRVPLPPPSIDLIKTGVFNDESGDGFAQAGETISYSFTVSNGPVTLTNVTLADPGITVFGGPISVLAAGVIDSVTFTGTYVVTQADINLGFKDNTATVTGLDPMQSPVADSDSARVLLPSPVPPGAGTSPVSPPPPDPPVEEEPVAEDPIPATLTIVKLADPADTTDTFQFTSPELPDFALGAGDSIVLEDLETGDYTITEGVLEGWITESISCNVPFAAEGGSLTITLIAADVVTCTFTNVAEAEEEPVGEEPISSIDVEKLTNGVDADSGTGPAIPAGSTVTWTYIVTNTGATVLENVAIIDDAGTPQDPSDDFIVTQSGSLAPGESHSYEMTGEAVLGDYVNVAVATATVATGAAGAELGAAQAGATLVSDEDRSAYTGKAVPQPPTALPNTGTGGLANHTSGPLPLLLAIGAVVSVATALTGVRWSRRQRARSA